MKEKELVEEIKEEEEVKNVLLHTYIHTHAVQNENRDSPKPALQAGCALQTRGAWFNKGIRNIFGFYVFRNNSTMLSWE